MQRIMCNARVWAAACALVVVVAHAGPNSWTVAGPDGAEMHSIAVHPSNPNIVLAGSAAGLHRTIDRGATWTRVEYSLFNHPDRIAFDPSQHDRVFVTDGALYRSVDAGQTLNRVLDVPHARFVEIANDGTVYAASYDGHLYRSQNGGTSWTGLAGAWPDPAQTGAIAVDPNDSDVVYVTINWHGTFKSIDAGQSWTGPVTDSPGFPAPQSLTPAGFALVVHPTNSNRVLAASNRGLLVSDDAGASWQVTDAFQLVFSIVFDPSNPQRVIAVNARGEVLRSADGGLSWPYQLQGANLQQSRVARVAADPSTPSGIVVASNDGPLFSNDWGSTFQLSNRGIRAGSLIALAGASDGTVVAAFDTGPRGAFKRGATDWEGLDNEELFAALGRPIGLSSIAVDPQDSQFMYVLNREYGVIRSLDGGLSWSAPDAGFLGRASQTVDVAIDPADGAVAYVSTLNDALWKTEDRGATWTQRSNGLPAHAAFITIDPADSQHVYVAASNDTAFYRLYESHDGGSSWQVVPAIASQPLSCLTIDPSDSRVMYLCAGFTLYKSVDAGAHWSAVDFGAPDGTTSQVREVLIDPVRSSTVIAIGIMGSHGFLRSVDSGASWERVEYPLSIPQSSILTGILNPQRPSMLIAGGYNAAVAEYEVAPDLLLELTPIATPLATGSAQQVTLTVRNVGPHASSTARATIQLPAGLTTNVPSGCSVNANVLACVFDALRVDESRSVAFNLQAGATPSSGSLQAAIAGHESDANPSNNTVTRALSWTAQADLEITLTPSSQAVDEGGTVTLTALVTNRGPSSATNTRLTVTAPAGLLLQQGTPSQGTCAISGATLACALGTVANAGQRTVTIVAAAASAGTATVSADAASDAMDGDADQATTSSVTVQAIAVPTPPTPPIPTPTTPTPPTPIAPTPPTPAPTTPTPDPPAAAPAKSSGGGGSFGMIELMLLALIALANRRRLLTPSRPSPAATSTPA